MGFLNFLGRVARKVGGGLRRVGSWVGNAIRTVAGPLASPIKSIANTVAGVTGFNATLPGAAIMGLANTALDALGNGAAARAADRVASAGARTQAFGAQLAGGG
jgi:hypothetical protein